MVCEVHVYASPSWGKGPSFGTSNLAASSHEFVDVQFWKAAKIPKKTPAKWGLLVISRLTTALVGVNKNQLPIYKAIYRGLTPFDT